MNDFSILKKFQNELLKVVTRLFEFIKSIYNVVVATLLNFNLIEADG